MAQICIGTCADEHVALANGHLEREKGSQSAVAREAQLCTGDSEDGSGEKKWCNSEVRYALRCIREDGEHQRRKRRAGIGVG